LNRGMNFLELSWLSPAIFEPKSGWLREEQLANWWFSLPIGSRLKTVEGDTIHLLEYGDKNRYEGPDVNGVLLLSSEGLLRGDVEFHLREKDWNYHGHHTNPRFDNVVLHVVLEIDASRVRKTDGRAVPAVIVPIKAVERLSPKSCRLDAVIDSERVLSALWPMTHIRWREKLSAVREAVKRCSDIRQAFFESTFWALGLKGNEDNFLRLSRLTTLRELERLGDEVRIHKYLLHWSGIDEGDKQVNPSIYWRRCGIRPAAHPESRLKFGAAVAVKLLSGWEPWSNREDGTFKALNGLFDKSLPGQSWCFEWLGNVIIPFQAIWEEENSEKVSELLEEWWRLKSSQTYGKLNSQFKGFISPQLLKSFGVRQGLLALQSRYCNEKLCDFCPLRGE